MRRKLIQYVKSAFYNIRQNKAYSIFCISGTALTFIFVIFLAQVAYSLLSNYPPTVHADHIIVVDNFTDTKGQNVGGLSRTEIELLLQDVREHTSFSIIKQTAVNALINGRYTFSSASYVNADFWDMNEYKYVAGQPFTKKECNVRKNCVVITNNLSKTYFRTANSLGEKIEIQGDEFEIVGIVDDISLFSSPSGATEIWFPDTFYPSTVHFTLHILFSPQTNMLRAKEIVRRAVEQSFNKKNITVDARKIYTFKEKKIGNQEGSVLVGLSIGVLVLLLLLLLIPAVNILTLNMAYTRNRAEEIAIRRAFGAGRFSSFFQLILEDLFLVFVGTLIGIILIRPFVSYIQSNFFDIPMFGSIPLIAGVDLVVIAGVIVPLMILFLFMFGGIPAYMIAKRNIADILKGGMQ